MRFAEAPLPFERAPPLLGQHTAEMLGEIGLGRSRDRGPRRARRGLTEKHDMPASPCPPADEMTPEQRRVHDAIVAGPRGTVIGPLRAVIHNPELAERWSALGEILRFGTSLPKRLNELAIIVTGRRWTSQIEWWVHARAAAAAGLPEAAIEAIRVGEPPEFDEPDDALVYEFARQLQQIRPRAARHLPRRGGALGRDGRGRAHRRGRLLHHGLDDAERARDPAARRRRRAALAAPRRRRRRPDPAAARAAAADRRPPPRGSGGCAASTTSRARHPRHSADTDGATAMLTQTSRRGGVAGLGAGPEPRAQGSPRPARPADRALRGGRARGHRRPADRPRHGGTARPAGGGGQPFGRRRRRGRGGGGAQPAGRPDRRPRQHRRPGRPAAHDAAHALRPGARPRPDLAGADGAAPARGGPARAGAHLAGAAGAGPPAGRGSSPSARPATGARRTSRASSSACAPGSTWCTCPTAARRRR